MSESTTQSYLSPQEWESLWDWYDEAIITHGSGNGECD